MKKLILSAVFGTLVFTCLSCAQNEKNSVDNQEVESTEEKTCKPDTLSILVGGDLMQHGPQIRSAQKKDGTYDYTECFALVKDEVSSADLAIANFEVTLGGPPYKGYPCFSAPDEYLRDILATGFDVLTTGNNHCLDSGKRGFERTLIMMDSLKIPHLGTYLNQAERDKTYPLLVEKNGFRVALLNFTYSTNGLPIQKPNVVNHIDTLQIAKDIEKAKAMQPDLIIALPHWGVEYQLIPNSQQRTLASWLFSKGVDHIVGSHPHVVQPMELRNGNAENGGNVLAYSLGNFVSNQYMENCMGGAMVKMVFEKKDGQVRLINHGYFLIYCSRFQNSGKIHRVMPADMDEPLNATDIRIRDKWLGTINRLFEKYNVDFGPFK